MNNKETVAYRRFWINIYKVTQGCEICGYNKHPSALCFDHLPDFEKHEMTKNGCSKRNHAGGMFMLYSKKYPPELLLEEIKKCRVLCHNCHMEHTHHKYSDVKPLVFMNFENLQDVLENDDKL